MSFVVYFFVLLITIGSVAFGLDWLHAPMSPMPPSKYELRAAKPPEPPQPAVAQTKPDSKPVNQQAAEPQPAAKPVAAVTPPPAAEPQPAPIAAPESVAAAPPPRCDIAACGAAYRSFTPVDCTYQPTDGSRRLCTKGTPPAAAAPASGAPLARAQAACNVAACSQAYISFNVGDCTYQPLDGPRRLCEK
jgi:outer membrane biosynthesis protein TonB